MLGGDPTPKPNQKRRRDETLIIGKEKPGPAYNHCELLLYNLSQKQLLVHVSCEAPHIISFFSVVVADASGRGWWDCDREGIDNEEVGLNEVWEGVGSTTLGGIEWH